MKKCTKCKQEKDIVYFSKDRYKKDGLRPNCKQCDKEYRVLVKAIEVEELEPMEEPGFESFVSWMKGFFR